MSLIVPQTRSAPRHPRYDAIHQALLTGLISHVATKTETHEYLGTRGTRISIFPGSVLFDQKPKWIVAGELVETTKLYARTCASVQPQWIEQAAAHLVERSYSDPRWDSQTASVLATEKVTLHGLVLIPARSVAYAPIQPRLCREMFIHHALVLGDFRPGGRMPAFARHNAALVAEVEQLEAKIRQRNLLADAATRYAFYDARVPLEVTSGAAFESWRRRAERGNPRLLHMDKADLLRADAPEITPRNYPDRLGDAESHLVLPLAYRYEPGEAADGLTLSVPVAALTQLRPQVFEWLVPGMLEEKIAAMLRELPGQLRRSFVPVPSWARAAAEALQVDFPQFSRGPWALQAAKDHGSQADQASSLREALARYLGRQTGMEIRAEDFLETALPPYLRMCFKVLDDEGRVLGASRDLAALQHTFAPQAAGSFATIAQPTYNRHGVKTWDFGDLPESVSVQRFGMTILAYPALVECSAATPDGGPAPIPGDAACALRLWPSRQAADDAHRAGLRQLLRLAHRREVKRVALNLPRFVQMALQHFTLGESRILREDLVTLILDRALLAAPGAASAEAVDLPLPRTFDTWRAMEHCAMGRLEETSERVAAIVAELLQRYHELTLALESASHTWGAGALSDVRQQLAHLVPPHFLLTTPWEWLLHFPRYLQAMTLRLHRLETLGAAAGQRDLQGMEAVAPWWKRYLERRAQHAAVGLRDPQLDLFRWMVEEYRVHLFAQELGCAVQVSPKRLEKQWDKVRR